MPAFGIIGGALGAIGGGSVLGGALTVGSGIAGLMGSRAQANAAQNGVRTQAQSTEQQLALQREMFNATRTGLQPYMQGGNTAQTAQMALLGLGGDATAQNAAFDRFRDSTGYQFQFDEGMRALNGANAAGNRRLSGGALADAVRLGHGYGANSFNNYYNQVAGVGDRGFAAASALGGVGQNFANSSSSIMQNLADNRTNAALVNGQNSANMWGGLGSILGGFAGRTSFG